MWFEAEQAPKTTNTIHTQHRRLRRLLLVTVTSTTALVLLEQGSDPYEYDYKQFAQEDKRTTGLLQERIRLAPDRLLMGCTTAHNGVHLSWAGAAPSAQPVPSLPNHDANTRFSTTAPRPNFWFRVTGAGDYQGGKATDSPINQFQPQRVPVASFFLSFLI